jgi:integrase
MKWKQASAKYRKDIARALTAATPAMLMEARGRPDDASVRRALVRWGFNTKQRSDPPEDVAEVLGWLAHNSVPVSALADAATARRVLVQATGRLDGNNAAASTARRNRTILANAVDYAVDLGLLDANSIRMIKWAAPKVSSQLDRRSVVNPRQARALLETVRAQRPSGPRLVAFFAVMYYAGLRPEEAINLARDNVILPPQVWDEKASSGRPLRRTRTGASCIFAAPRPTQAVSGPMMEACGSGGSSSTGRTETAASSPLTRN